MVIGDHAHAHRDAAHGILRFESYYAADESCREVEVTPQPRHNFRVKGVTARSQKMYLYCANV